MWSSRVLWIWSHSRISQDQITTGKRLFLFMDVLRLLPYLFGLLNRMIIKAIAASPFIRNIKRNHEVWEHHMSADMELIHQGSAPNLDAFL
jgi:hypothetical protein